MSQNNPGYIWVPYIVDVDQSVTVISESFNPKKSIRSRYSINGLSNSKRINKSKKILEKIEDFKNKIIC